MTENTRDKHLAGPWHAVISSHGDAYDSVRDARIELGDEEEAEISVRRATALPVHGDLPGTYHSADVAYEIDCYLVDPDDEGCGAVARWAQAQAMAAGLNAAVVAVSR